MIDESFAEAVFDTTAWASATIPGGGPEVAIVNSLSKGLHLQGLRVGACLVHRSVASDVIAVHQAVTGGVSSLSQAAARDVLVAQPDHALRLGPQRERLVAFIQAQGWPCLSAQGSFYHFPNVGPIGAFDRALDGSGVFHLSGAAFGLGVENHVRMCFARPLGELDAIIDRMGRHIPAAGSR